MSSENIGVLLSILNGLGLIVAGAITTYRSVSAVNVKTLQSRVEASEKSEEELWEELQLEQRYSRLLAAWGHSVVVEAAAQGVTLPDLPRRPQQPSPRRGESSDGR